MKQYHFTSWVNVWAVKRAWNGRNLRHAQLIFSVKRWELTIGLMIWFLRWVLRGVLKGEIFLVWCKRWFRMEREMGCSWLYVTSYCVLRALKSIGWCRSWRAGMYRVLSEGFFFLIFYWRWGSETRVHMGSPCRFSLKAMEFNRRMRSYSCIGGFS